MTFSQRYFRPSLSFATLRRFIDYALEDDMCERQALRMAEARNAGIILGVTV